MCYTVGHTYILETMHEQVSYDLYFAFTEVTTLYVFYICINNRFLTSDTVLKVKQIVLKYYT